MAERARVYPLRREPRPDLAAAPRDRRVEVFPARRDRAGSRDLPVQVPAPHGDQEPPAPEPLWREVLGQLLRALRQEQHETLAETAGRAGISPQYLSEIERGRKEPSSEMIAALAGALGTTLTRLTEQVADGLRHQQAISLARVARPHAPGPRASGPVMLSLAA